MHRRFVSKTHHLKFSSRAITSLLHHNDTTKLKIACDCVEIEAKWYQEQGYTVAESTLLGLERFKTRLAFTGVDEAELETLVRQRAMERQRGLN